MGVYIQMNEQKKGWDVHTNERTKKRTNIILDTDNINTINILIPCMELSILFPMETNAPPLHLLYCINVDLNQ